MTARPSYAIGSSIQSMPLALQSSASLFLIGRDAPVMSTSPRQNFLKPPPVPDSPTVTVPCPAFWKSSATACDTRNTVLDPSTLIGPPPLDAVAPLPPGSPVPPTSCLRFEQPAAVATTIARKQSLFM